MQKCSHSWYWTHCRLLMPERLRRRLLTTTGSANKLEQENKENVLGHFYLLTKTRRRLYIRHIEHARRKTANKAWISPNIKAGMTRLFVSGSLQQCHATVVINIRVTIKLNSTYPWKINRPLFCLEYQHWQREIVLAGIQLTSYKIQEKN